MSLDNKNIQEGTILIAGFMNYFEKAIAFCERKNISYDWKTDYVELEGLKYHSSWDWLMPVIDKINGFGKEYSLAIFKTYISLTVEKSGKMYKDFSFAHSEYITKEQTGLEAAFKLIVKFIKWYNEYNKNK